MAFRGSLLRRLTSVFFFLLMLVVCFMVASRIDDGGTLSRYPSLVATVDTACGLLAFELEKPRMIFTIGDETRLSLRMSSTGNASIPELTALLTGPATTAAVFDVTDHLLRTTSTPVHELNTKNELRVFASFSVPDVPGNYTMSIYLHFCDISLVTKASLNNMTLVDQLNRNALPTENSTIFKFSVEIVARAEEHSLAKAVPECEGHVVTNSLGGAWQAVVNEGHIRRTWQPKECSHWTEPRPEHLKAWLMTHKVLFVGDSLIRTVFLAFTDIVFNYTFPYNSIGHERCRGTPDVVDTAFDVAGSHASVAWLGCLPEGAYVGLSKGERLFEYRNAAVASLQSVLPIAEIVRSGSYEYLVVNFGLHDLNRGLDVSFKDLKFAIEHLATLFERTKIIWIGLWASNINKKPYVYKWTGSHIMSAIFNKNAEEILAREGIAWIRTVPMTLSVQEWNVDGVHYNLSLTSPLGRLLAHDLMLLSKRKFQDSAAL